MRHTIDAVPQALHREPWNKGKLIGAKPPLRPKHVWSIRTKVQIAGRTRDLAMFNLAIDSKLRACDVLRQLSFDCPYQLLAPLRAGLERLARDQLVRLNGLLEDG
jgi:hypothetical protein